MSLQPLLAQFLADLTGPWATGIATVLLVFTGVGVIPGHPDTAWAWILHLVVAFCLLIVGANFLSALGWLP
ncbi:MAG TPA: TrbC/VirB2 family protein [Candidatus Competibacteraceae bacterium]|nr:TrbC/VirB2 family protein [Candidatus Competibacteraceae bacterium]